MKHITMPAAVLALASQLVAGGFYLQLGNPEANPEARKHNAVLVVKAAGCHDPAGASITATATGVVEGKRQTIALDVIRLSDPGSFAIAQQWPKTGRWAIQITGKNETQFTNTLVSAGPEGVDRLHAKYEVKPFTGRDVDAMLND
jgi:hypothetical protein